jgi:2-oxoglutarate ferredoxin oxidoreductase subunit delta
MSNHWKPESLAEVATSQLGVLAGEKMSAALRRRRPLAPPQRLRLIEGEIRIIVDRCKGCGFCIDFCPRGVLESSSKLNSRGVYPPRVKNEDECKGCTICERLCPEFAIFLEPRRS